MKLQCVNDVPLYFFQRFACSYACNVFICRCRSKIVRHPININNYYPHDKTLLSLYVFIWLTGKDINNYII